MTKRIGITLGEPLGIGPEIVVRALAEAAEYDAKFVIYGSPRLIEKTALTVRTEPFWKVVTSKSDKTGVQLFATGPDPSGGFHGDNRAERARAVIATLDQAISDCMEGYCDALITAPIDKAVVRTILPQFTGHTEYLEEKTGVPQTVMLLDNTEIRVVPLTQHIPLRDVSRSVTASEMERTLRTAAIGLSKWFNVKEPRIAIAGLNPHAGEIVKDAEETVVMKPVIEKLRAEGWQIDGPFAADSLFPMARNQSLDFILSPYHDQGLIAVKYLGLDKVVNITLGLPFLRASPGHGVAYDIAGQNKADARSFKRALRIAIKGRLVE